MNKPYYLRKEGSAKGIYLRLGRSTVHANEDLVEELKWESRGVYFDSMPVYQAKEDDLDIAKIEKFLATRKSAQTKNASYDSLQEAMLAYKIIAAEHTHYYPTTCGILLFAKDPQFFFPEARIMCNSFASITMSREVVASRECLGTLDDQFRMAYQFILNQLNTTWKIIGTVREEHLEIPQQAIRETLMNAIIHRNYRIPGPNKVAIFQNRIEIFSPGFFAGPAGKNLKAGFTAARNPFICKVFREMGLIESFGFGLLEIFASYQEAQLKEPEIVEGDFFVKCILPRRTPENILTRSKKKDFDQDYANILDLFISATEISVSDIIKVLHLARPTASRKLAELAKKGLIAKIGKGRGVRYIKS